MDFAEAAVQFLFAFTYTQRTAEPFYIYDTLGYFQSLFNYSPILHYMKEAPSGAKNLALETSVADVVNGLSLNYLRRTAASILQYNPETDNRVKQFLINMGVQRQVFDVGIVLQTDSCVPAVLKQVASLQTRTGKKSLKVFVATERMDLLQEFATKGNPSWSFVSLLRNNQPNDPRYFLEKTLAELQTLRGLEYVAVSFGSALGKLIYLTSTAITMESQILSLDGKSWKAME